MAKTTIKLNYEGVGKLLKSGEMQQALSKIATNVALRADGETENYMAQTRAIATVSVANNSKNMDNNTLLKALR